MSQYCTVRTEFRNLQALLHALSETGGWVLENIEVHEGGQNLIGYRGDTRPEIAHVIIRKGFVGDASNDIGFVKTEEGSYAAIISQYDKTRYNQQWLNNLKKNYAFHSIKIEQENRGRTVSREILDKGRQRITVNGYR